MKAIALVLLACLYMMPYEAFAWPKIQPVHGQFELSRNKVNAKVLLIEDVKGTPRYLFEAYLNAYNYADQDNDYSFLYSGIFECRLRSLYDNISTTLFGEDRKGGPEWDTRARFLPEEILGKNKFIPECGRKRTFCLRGFKMVIEVIDVKVEKNTSFDKDEEGFDVWATNLTFKLDVEPDEKITSSLALPIKVDCPK